MLSNVRRRRSELLSEVLGAVRVLRIRVLNSSEPISVLMRKSELPMFQNLAAETNAGVSPGEAWTRLKEKAQGELEALTESDRQILDDFFAHLGASGRNEQDELFSRVAAQLEAAQTQARNRFTDASKTFTALGALIGVGICILIV